MTPAKRKSAFSAALREAQTATETSTATAPETFTETSTSTYTETAQKKRKKERFEQTHERVTLWLDRGLKHQFEALAEEQGIAKSTLLDEAISDLLRKAEHPEAAAAPARMADLEAEVRHLQQRLTVEERFRTDTEVRHFKSWLRTHDQPQDSDFANRLLADTRQPQHASRSLYEARLRASGYSAEDIHLFEEMWKTMLFVEGKK
jgi:ribbon-helix-helix protein